MQKTRFISTILGLSLALFPIFSSPALAQTSAGQPLQSRQRHHISDSAYSNPAPPLIRGPVSVSGYGGVSAAYSPILNQDGAMLGIEGAVVLNRRLAIGLAGQALSNSKVGVELDDVDRRLEMAFAGLVTRYSFLFNSPVYLTVGAISGAGSVVAAPLVREWRNADRVDDEDLVEREHVDVIAVFQPEATLHVNFTHWMRLAISGGYRVVLGVEKFDAKNSDVGGFVATGGLQFGGF